MLACDNYELLSTSFMLHRFIKTKVTDPKTIQISINGNKRLLTNSTDKNRQIIHTMLTETKLPYNIDLFDSDNQLVFHTVVNKQNFDQHLPIKPNLVV